MGPYHLAMAKAPVLTPRAHDFRRWYQDVVNKAELADIGPVRGTMVIRPYGYALWERMQAEMDARIKRAGAANAYFPLFIPQSVVPDARGRARRGLRARARRRHARRMRPRVFLRTTEFLRQEGHTAHATYEDARDYAAQIPGAPPPAWSAA